MIKNPKNKKGLLSNVREMLPRGVYHKFDDNTTLVLYLYEKPQVHTLKTITTNLNGSVEVKTIVNGEEYVDRLEDFDFSEMKSIIKILAKEQGR